MGPVRRPRVAPRRSRWAGFRRWLGTLLPVGITQRPPARPAAGPESTAVSAGAYAMLFLLGLAQGVLGSFQYSRAVLGGVPAAAIGFALGILVTCVLGGWAMRGLPGALVPAVGWFVASFVLAMPDAAGNVIIANTSAGQWYLYGGSAGALAGVGSAFFTAPRRPPRGAGSGPNGSGA